MNLTKSQIADVIAFVNNEPELPGSMPWKNRWMFFKFFITGKWARLARATVRGTKRAIVRRLESLVPID